MKRGRCVTSPRIGAAKRRRGQRKSGKLSYHQQNSHLPGMRKRTLMQRLFQSEQERKEAQRIAARTEIKHPEQSGSGRTRRFFSRMVAVLHVGGVFSRKG